MPETPPNPQTDPSQSFDSVSYTSILQEHDVDSQQRAKRRELLEDLQKPKLNNGHKKCGTIGFVSHDSLSSNDIPVLGNMLLKLGDLDTLNLILHSPGGDGTVVETFVSLCRAHCERFRVIIPTLAKSAATLISLGADEIVMGPPSEIGPIDAQVPIVVSGARRYASAQSFIDARDSLLKKHENCVNDGNDPSAILQMIASLDLPFIVECERLMDFGRDVGRKLLTNHMFSNDKGKEKKADNTVEQLSSVQLHKVHGRTINGRTARQELGLNVNLCGNDDELWRKAWQWYTRAEFHLGRIRGAKMFESKHEILAAIGYRE